MYPEGVLMRKVFFAIGAMILFGVPLFTGAETTNFTATAKITTKVKLSATSMNFGEMDDAGTYRAEAVISVKAPAGTSFHIAINGGLHYAAGSRWMQGAEGLGQIAYQVFKDPGFSQQWGDGDFDGTFPQGTSLAGVGMGPKTDFIPYGRLVLRETPPPGYYQDMLTVTVHY